jgi:hypothetical protein
MEQSTWKGLRDIPERSETTAGNPFAALCPKVFRQSKTQQQFPGKTGEVGSNTLEKTARSGTEAAKHK